MTWDYYDIEKREIDSHFEGVSLDDMHEYLQGELYKLRGGSELTKMDIKLLSLIEAVKQHGIGE
jgi:hypothetical protein